VAGVVACDSSTKTATPLYARAVLLATGGLGCVYLETTNPDVATGDGVAAAYRAGAEISDIEFVQFHPTALRIEGAPRFLLTEALRGEGAFLRNDKGERFMERYHPMKELAPRDVVSRSMVAEIQRTGAAHVYLDLTHLDGAFLRERFPRVYGTCLQYDIDITRRAAPVHPAAHYAMGGVRTDLDGRTSLGRLYAAGEVACTGVHGANRLASNSLLEGVVYGARAGMDMRKWAGSPPARQTRLPEVRFPEASREEMRRLAWNKCGIVRCGEGLAEACDRLEGVNLNVCANPNRELLEVRNIREVLLLIARCCLARRESRGGHYRTDFPEKVPGFQKHSLASGAGEIGFY